MTINYIVQRAERIACDFLKERAKTSYLIIDKGIVNQVCVVETLSCKVVVRMNDIGTYSSYVKERWCIEQSAAVGIPGPEVLSIGITDDAAYMIQTFVDGDNGLDSSVPKSSIWRQLGEYAKRIHSIRVKGYGENLIDPVHGEFQSPPHAGSNGSWLGYVQYNINSLTELDPLIGLGVISPMESQRVRKLFEHMKQRTYRFGLIHGDISLKNTIVTQAGQVILIDWGCAVVSTVPHGEITYLMQRYIQSEGPNNEEFKAFIDGYGISEKDLDDSRHILLLSAFDKLRWAIDRSPDLIEPYAAYAKKAVKMFVDQQRLS
ncbi:phosphotransferase family protein [Paenibacillus sp. MCAF20]